MRADQIIRICLKGIVRGVKYRSTEEEMGRLNWRASASVRLQNTEAAENREHRRGFDRNAASKAEDDATGAVSKYK